MKKVIETVNEFDNVLYEISNENHPPSTPWQYHMIRLIKEQEKTRPKQHPVGMTFQYKDGKNQTLFESPADWISPNSDGGYRNNPPAANGSKVILTDTDHLWGIGGNSAWVWKSVLRGLNPIFMDPYDGLVLSKSGELQWTEPVRKSMGQALQWSRRVDLAQLLPYPALASSGFCLANPGREYLVYLPDGKEVTMDLGEGGGRFAVEWFNPQTDRTEKAEAVASGRSVRLSPPFQSSEALLHLAVERR